MLKTNMIKVGGKDSVENVGFLNIRGYMTTVWTLKYWNRGLFFSEYFEEFPVNIGSVPTDERVTYLWEVEGVHVCCHTQSRGVM